MKKKNQLCLLVRICLSQISSSALASLLLQLLILLKKVHCHQSLKQLSARH